MNGKRFSEGKARRNGFYLALAVCLVAVGIAAWSTFDAVQGYLDPPDASGDAALAQSQAQDVRQGQQDDDPEAPRGSGSTSSAASRVSSAASQGAKATTGTVSRAPTRSPAPTPEPEPEESEAPVPATAPLYEISEEMLYPLGAKEVMKAYSSGAPMYSETMKDWRIHAGCDLTAAQGEQVVACANGIVKEAYTDNMLGQVLVVEHGDYTFYYCGIEAQVQPEDVVSMGQALGTVATVPGESADNPHLHLEVRRDGAYLDPRSVLEGEN